MTPEYRWNNLPYYTSQNVERVRLLLVYKSRLQHTLYIITNLSINRRQGKICKISTEPLLYMERRNSLNLQSDEDKEGWSLRQTFREWRHSPRCMVPISVILISSLTIFALALRISRLPLVLLNLLLCAPVMKRTNWFVQFLYPFNIAKWGHIFLVRFSMRGNKNTFHTRAIEQRVEVFKRRVYIHTIPVFTDNLVYLILSYPNRREPISVPIVGVLVDCGDAAPVLEALELIQDTHYEGRKIQIVAILCTHKHHDHTAGNKQIVDYELNQGHEVRVYGGAVENVPFCTHFLQHGEKIIVPSVEDNNMNRFVQIEAISAPSHTRGSIVYRLSLNSSGLNRIQSKPVHHLFTGDSMFSGGAGLPFEADLDFGKEKPSNIEKRKAHHPVRPTVGTYSIERCFSEILVRCSPFYHEHQPNIMIYPGHEYTSELLQRQLTPSKRTNPEWHRLPPSHFFEIASQYLIAQHRRTMPRGSKLLTVPTCLSRELIINPHFRNLRKQGHFFIAALKIWYKFLSRKKFKAHQLNLTHHEDNSETEPSHFLNEKTIEKSESAFNTWNISYEDVSRPVFTTVYTTDLQNIISDLRSNAISPKAAADTLSKLSSKLEIPTTTRRPIPNTLPTDKTIWLGSMALTVLGSAPCGLTRSDAARMKLPPPKRNSDNIKISRERILLVLLRLGVLSGLDCSEARLINLLWKEASWDDLHLKELDEEHVNQTNKNGYDSTVETENLECLQDEIELGYLKMELYGVNYNRTNKSWFCMPCGPCSNNKNRSTASTGTTSPQSSNNREKSRMNNLKDMKRANGELLRHDTEYCPMCKDNLGCPVYSERMELQIMESEEENSIAAVESMVMEAASLASSSVANFDDNINPGGEMEVVIVDDLPFIKSH